MDPHGDLVALPRRSQFTVRRWLSSHAGAVMRLAADLVTPGLQAQWIQRAQEHATGLDLAAGLGGGRYAPASGGEG